MMDAGVPGIRSKVAVINPPLTEPTYMETNSTKALFPSMEKVNGKLKAISIAPVNPGTAPTITPRLVPRAINAKAGGDKRNCIVFSKAEKSYSSSQVGTEPGIRTLADPRCRSHGKTIG